MPPTLQDLGIESLGVDDKLALAEAIWESVAADIERSPLTEAQRRELERRGMDWTGAVVPWEVVKGRSQKRAGQ